MEEKVGNKFEHIGTGEASMSQTLIAETLRVNTWQRTSSFEEAVYRMGKLFSNFIYLKHLKTAAKWGMDLNRVLKR